MSATSLKEESRSNSSSDNFKAEPYAPANLHHARLGHHAVSLWAKHNMTDITIRCGNRTFEAHKAVLTCYCPFFRRKLLDPQNCNVRGIDLLNITGEAMETLLTYMYTGNLNLSCWNIGDVYRATRLLDMKEVTHICAQILSGKLGGPASTLYLYITAKKMGIPRACKRAYKMMCTKFDAIVESPEYLQIDADLVCELLSANDLNTSGELSIFLAALRWLHYKFLEREPFILKVMKCIRFGLMTLEEVLHCFYPPIIPGIMEFPAIQAMLLEAVCYLSAKEIGFEMFFRPFTPVPRTFTAEGDPCDLLWNLILFYPFYVTDDDVEKSALTIQAAWRGFVAKKETKQTMYLYNYLASIIQAVWRGHRIRKENYSYLDSLQRKMKQSSPQGGTQDPCLIHLLRHPEGITGVSDEWSEHTASTISNVKLKRETSPMPVLIGGINPHNANDIVSSCLMIRFTGTEWERVGRLPSPRHHLCAAFLHDVLYVIGGCDTRDTLNSEMIATRICYAFHLDDQKWMRIANLNHARMYHGAAVLGDTIYVVGGKDEYGVLLSSVEQFVAKNGQERWIELFCALSCPRMGAGVTAASGMLWVVGGLVQPTDGEKVFVVRDVECYHPGTSQWILDTQPFPVPRCFLSLTSCQKYLIAIGGASRSKSCREPHLLSSNEVYVYQGLAWSNAVFLPNARHSAAVCSVEDSIYVFGGLSTQQGSGMTSSLTIKLDDLVGRGGSWTETTPLPSTLANMAIEVIPAAEKEEEETADE